MIHFFSSLFIPFSSYLPSYTLHWHQYFVSNFTSYILHFRANNTFFIYLEWPKKNSSWLRRKMKKYFSISSIFTPTAKKLCNLLYMTYVLWRRLHRDEKPYLNPLPIHCLPSEDTSKPRGQVQTKLPGVLVHCPPLHIPSEHSFTSTKKNAMEHVIKCKFTLGWNSMNIIFLWTSLHTLVHRHFSLSYIPDNSYR